jgi:hypothetical protein
MNIVFKINYLNDNDGCRSNKNYVLPNKIFDTVSIPYVDQSKLLGVIIIKKLIFTYH